ncbi:hypothetical protein [Stenotrophomonas sp. 24(2023)]|uniref:hypothetical protein n=1 Tax=Stenotrophomonas sp. 24(2023) TaxID=3068324 RepID=UPI0027DFCD08|nr:hypothetical protein [Stenotrophomonas sp. 24(2023)]WMJ69285.1 hypothetical protein Q9R17_19245 [Stenotrophomonas sp. 24(2023)]
MHAPLSYTLLLATTLLAGTAGADTPRQGKVDGRATPGQQLYLINKGSGAIIGVVADARGHFVAVAPEGHYELTAQQGLACSTPVDITHGTTHHAVLADCTAR